MRQSAIGLVLELDPKSIRQEELDHANNLCYGVNEKLYRIITFGVEAEGINEFAQNLGLSRARISYVLAKPGSPNDGIQYQVEEILPEEASID